jgi:hypothetical protein
MSFTVLALWVAVVWLAIGVMVSIGMRRRGHAFFTASKREGGVAVLVGVQ